ncbi:MAG: hypothetical protein HYV16_00955 [Gammaproteobacteria bacterium]|nr:hypothetical protein [Gammaproteobacteria bacterium]
MGELSNGAFLEAVLLTLVDKLGTYAAKLDGFFQQADRLKRMTQEAAFLGGAFLP